MNQSVNTDRARQRGRAAPTLDGAVELPEPGPEPEPELHDLDLSERGHSETKLADTHLPEMDFADLSMSELDLPELNPARQDPLLGLEDDIDFGDLRGRGADPTAGDHGDGPAREFTHLPDMEDFSPRDLPSPLDSDTDAGKLLSTEGTDPPPVQLLPRVSDQIQSATRPAGARGDSARPAWR